MSLPENWGSPYADMKRARGNMNVIGFAEPEQEYTLCCRNQRTVMYNNNPNLQICTACGRLYEKRKEPVKPSKATGLRHGKKEKPFVYSAPGRTGSKQKKVPKDLEGAIPGATWGEDRDLGNG